MLNFFYRLPYTVAQCFWRYILVLHVAAIVLTYFIVTSGFDWVYFISSRNPSLQAFLFPAAVIGGILPFLVPVTLYLVGAIKRNMRILNTAFALGQAAFVAWFITSFYKAFTGRVPPPFHAVATAIDNSQVFQFGFLRGGIFWGWPSTHTAVAFSMAVTLLMLYPKNRFLRYGALLYALYVGIGISTNIHWFSDFVAGVLIGIGIGVTVGKSFLKRLNLQR